ncbi:MAG: hypothetical protein U5K51_06995 [Flavobacteriaceae bacterium]|nr:hypothetical protein [Flavobacteriaceae bacterium]
MFFAQLCIVFGVALINKFDWIIYVFGAFLIYTAYKMLKTDQADFNPKKSFIFRKLRKVLPFTAFIHGENFFIRRMGILIAPIIYGLGDDGTH